MEKIPDIIHESWHELLQPLFDDPKMDIIKTKLLPYCKFYPEAAHIFRVFEMPIDEVKVVVLGQDPYFNGSAIGYAFAVSEKSPVPKSLDIILKEVIQPTTSEEFVDFKLKNPNWKTLQHWRDQGVFLLNSALTVEIGEAGSHLGQWMWFTREVIRKLSQHHTMIWILWGSKAQGFREYIADKRFWLKREVETVDAYNWILEAPHPAAGSYGNPKRFEGCNHFKLCNEILDAKKKEFINW